MCVELKINWLSPKRAEIHIYELQTERLLQNAKLMHSDAQWYSVSGI